MSLWEKILAMEWQWPRALCNIQIYFYSFWSDKIPVWVGGLADQVLTKQCFSKTKISPRDVLLCIFSQDSGMSGISWIRSISCLVWYMKGISWCAWNYIWVIQAARKRITVFIFPPNNFMVQILFNHQNFGYIKYFSFNFKPALVACVTLVPS